MTHEKKNTVYLCETKPAEWDSSTDRTALCVCDLKIQTISSKSSSNLNKKTRRHPGAGASRETEQENKL